MSEPVKCAKCGSPARAGFNSDTDVFWVECGTTCSRSVWIEGDFEQDVIDAWNRLNAPAVDWEKVLHDYVEWSGISPDDAFGHVNWFREHIEGGKK